MSLTASDHQKISALQQVVRMVSQMQSVAGNPMVAQNVVNNLLPLVERYTSDPNFQELASLLRRMRVDTSPSVQSEVVGLVNSMMSGVQGVLQEKKNAQGETVVWDPIRGMITSPRFEQGEKNTVMAPFDDWRGSKKYPFGKAFPEWNRLDGIELLQNSYVKVASCLAVLAGLTYLYKHKKNKK